jgi:hypothetical protein
MDNTTREHHQLQMMICVVVIVILPSNPAQIVNIEPKVAKLF